MRKAMWMALAGAMALAGCNNGSKSADANGDGQITGQEVQQAASAQGAAVYPDPGLYKISVAIEELTIPGMPTEMAGQIKQRMAAKTDIEQCITEADRQDAVKRMTQGAQNGDCTYSKYNIGGGTIDAQMTCKMGEGATADYAMHGTIARTGVDMTMESTQQSPTGGPPMHMKMHMTSQRTGACKS